MSLKGHLARVAIGLALMAGPIIGCDGDEPPYYYGSPGFGGFGGSSSSSSSGRPSGESSSEVCESVTEGVYCYSSARESVFCERGEHANSNCNPRLRCTGGVWEAETAERAVCAPTSACPTAYTESAPDLCNRPDAISLLCEYDEGTCGCAPVGGLDRKDPEPPFKKDAGTKDAGDAGDAGATGDAGDPGDAGAPKDAGPKPDAGPRTYEWKCMRPDRDAGCPRRRPREGIDCVRPLVCDYGYCVFEDGYAMRCSNGSWARDFSGSVLCDQ